MPTNIRYHTNYQILRGLFFWWLDQNRVILLKLNMLTQINCLIKVVITLNSCVYWYTNYLFWSSLLD